MFVGIGDQSDQPKLFYQHIPYSLDGVSDIYGYHAIAYTSQNRLVTYSFWWDESLVYDSEIWETQLEL